MGLHSLKDRVLNYVNEVGLELLYPRHVIDPAVYVVNSPLMMPTACCACSAITWFLVIVLIGSLASIPLLAFGIRGFINIEECAIGAVHSLDAFNFLTGIFFFVVFVTVLVVLYFMLRHLGGALSKESTVLHYLGAILMIVCVVIGIGDIAYSFYIASQVYGRFDEFQQGQVNCSSSVYYSSFVSVAIVFNYIFVEIALAVLVILWLKIDFRGRFLC